MLERTPSMSDLNELVFGQVCQVYTGTPMWNHMLFLETSENFVL